MESCWSPLLLQAEKPLLAVCCGRFKRKKGFTEKRGSPTGYWVAQRTLGKAGEPGVADRLETTKLRSDSTASAFRSKLPFSSLFKCRLYIWGELQKKRIEY